MHRLSLIAAIFAVVAGVFASTAASDPPQQFTIEDNVTFQSGFLTQACGLPVFITAQGTVHITLRTDRKGAVHEIDAFEDYALTFSAPSTGKSISFKFGPAFFEYPDGAYIGAPSIVTFLGVDSNYPGAPAEAGRIVSEGIVIDFTPEGVPIVDTTAVISQHGNFISNAEAVAFICAGLSG
jgi:hypothetical protein